MTRDISPGPEELVALVDAVDVTPEYFVRADGARMAVINGNFLDRVLAVYSEATVRSLAESPEVYDMKINET